MPTQPHTRRTAPKKKKASLAPLTLPEVESLPPIPQTPKTNTATPYDPAHSPSGRSLAASEISWIDSPTNDLRPLLTAKTPCTPRRSPRKHTVSSARPKTTKAQAQRPLPTLHHHQNTSPPGSNDGDSDVEEQAPTKNKGVKPVVRVFSAESAIRSLSVAGQEEGRCNR